MGNDEAADLDGMLLQAKLENCRFSRTHKAPEIEDMSIFKLQDSQNVQKKSCPEPLSS